MITIGSKVVCITKLTPRHDDPKDVKYPIVRQIYTVREITTLNNLTGLRLIEIVNKAVHYRDGFLEVAFTLKAFREVDYSFGEEVCSNVEQEVLELQEV